MEEFGFDRGSLFLNEPRNIFYSGQLIVGQLIFKLQQPLSFTAINIQFTGEANVIWVEREKEEYNGVVRRTEVQYRGHEEYFNHIQCLAGGGAASNLQLGSHNYSFQFRIPTMAPSSFTGEKGKVEYKVIAYMEFPDPMTPRKELVQYFEVVAPLDLNNGSPAIKQPTEISFEEVYSCCCSTNSLNLLIHLPVTGYCPGQTIKVTISADNESSTEVNDVILKLVKKTRFRSQVPPSDYILPEEVLATVHTGAILSNFKRQWTRHLTVPNMIAPNLENCRIIDVGFFLHVKAKVGGCNNDLEDESEICIGLVPLADREATEPYIHPMKDTLPNAPIPNPNEVIEANMSQPNLAPMPYATNSYPLPKSPSPLPRSVSPYPQNNSSYTQANSPYPQSNSPYIQSNRPNIVHPQMSPHPQSNSPYIPANSPYPQSANPNPQTVSPYPQSNSPYPRSISPYPQSNSPYPQSNNPYPPPSYASTASPMPNPPYSVEQTTGNQMGGIGFKVPDNIGMPTTPSYPVSYPSVNVTPSAPPL